MLADNLHLNAGIVVLAVATTQPLSEFAVLGVALLTATSVYLALAELTNQTPKALCSPVRVAGLRRVVPSVPSGFRFWRPMYGGRALIRAGAAIAAVALVVAGLGTAVWATEEIDGRVLVASGAYAVAAGVGTRVWLVPRPSIQRRLGHHLAVRAARRRAGDQAHAEARQCT